MKSDPGWQVDACYRGKDQKVGSSQSKALVAGQPARAEPEINLGPISDVFDQAGGQIIYMGDRRKGAAVLQHTGSGVDAECRFRTKRGGMRSMRLIRLGGRSAWLLPSSYPQSWTQGSTGQSIQQNSSKPGGI